MGRWWVLFLGRGRPVSWASPVLQVKIKLFWLDLDSTLPCIPSRKNQEQIINHLLCRKDNISGLEWDHLAWTS